MDPRTLAMLGLIAKHLEHLVDATREIRDELADMRKDRQEEHQ